MRIDSLYNLVVSPFLNLEIKVVQPGDELHFRRVAFDDYELLGEDAFYDKPAAIMLQSCLTKQLIETDIFLFIEPERVLVTRSFRFRSISEGGFPDGIHIWLKKGLSLGNDSGLAERAPLSDKC